MQEFPGLCGPLYKVAAVMAWLSDFFSNPVFEIMLKTRIIFDSTLNTILDDNIGHFPGSEPLLPAAGDGLALVVQHLDRAVHEVSGLDLKVCLPLRVDNAMDMEM